MILFNKNMARLKEGMLHKYLELSSRSDILSLSIGEPDFLTPYHIRQVAIDAIEQGKTFYTPAKGFLALRQEISHYYQRKYQLSYDPNTEIMVTVGASEGIEVAIRTLLNPGDEVLIIEPAYLSYEPLVVMAGAKAIYIKTNAEDGFKLTADMLRKAINEKTRLLVLNYPNNPTGAIMTYEDYAGLVEVLKDYPIHIISDEIYSELNYTHPHASLAHFPELKDRVIVINGFSKTYAMTGWRLGYLLASKELIHEFIKYHQIIILCPPTIAQFAGIEALKNGDEDIIMMRDEYDLRRRYALEKLNEIGLSCSSPQGAFYVFANVKKATGLESVAFCDALLEQQKVAVIPGIAFGEAGRDFIRFSYCYSLDHIKEAIRRMELFVKSFN
jgi:aminotransferase